MIKAYKLLAKRHNLSHNSAKALIDSGLVLCNGKRLAIARAEIATNATFEILESSKIDIIFENDEILAINKPAFVESYALERQFSGWELLHRLDKETSGIICLAKLDSAFAKKAKQAFKDRSVHKAYICLLQGILSEEVNINKPIVTIKKGFAKSFIANSAKNGLPAHTHLVPLSIIGKKTLAKAVILTGRTHQIRVHCQSINHPICGDRIYSSDTSSKRLMLHASEIALLDYHFSAPLPREFSALMR